MKKARFLVPARSESTRRLTGPKSSMGDKRAAATGQVVGRLAHSNMLKFTARIVPTFKDSVKLVVLTGASAGSFGAGLNFSMVQDAFGSVLVHVIMDSGIPFADAYMPVCMQKKWREIWNLNGSLPPDCTECFQADGGGLLGLADFLLRKHANSKVGGVSSMQDEIMRLFFSISNNDCANFETADPVLNYLTGIFAGELYTAGINDLRARYVSTGRLATYGLGGLNIIFHQHTWRPRFYDPLASPTFQSIAQWNTNFLNGNMQQVGP